MEPKFQTSFIPKKPIITTQGSSVSVVHSVNIFSIVAGVVFAVTIITAGGLFLYKTTLFNQIEQSKVEVDQAREAIQPEAIRNIIDSNSRIVASKDLLNKHVVVSKLLLLLQDLTVKKVRFSDFSYKNIDNKITLEMHGESQTYNALANQQEIFAKSEYIKNPQFSDFNLAANGFVTMGFTAQIDPTLVSYKVAIEGVNSNQ